MFSVSPKSKSCRTSLCSTFIKHQRITSEHQSYTLQVMLIGICFNKKEKGCQKDWRRDEISEQSRSKVIILSTHGGKFSFLWLDVWPNPIQHLFLPQTLDVRIHLNVFEQLILLQVKSHPMQTFNFIYDQSCMKQFLWN